MKFIKKHFYLALLVLMPLLVTSCYPAHSGSGGSLNGGGGGGNGGGGGGNNGNPSTFTIGGAVIGLVGTGMVLENNLADDLPIVANGTFTFKTAVSGPYAVTVKTQPIGPAQTCSVANGAGTATAKVANVVINCGTTGLTIGGSVSGLLGSGLVLQNNGADNFAVTGTGNVPFTFTTPVSPGTAYSVTISAQPKNPAQVCSIINGSGTANSNVNNVQVSCTQPGFTISGSVVGLVEAAGDTLELQDNAGDDLFVTGDTVFTFPTKVTNGGIYNVDVFLEPNSQRQPCNIFFYTGIAVTNVSDILVDCEHNDWDWISWYIGSTTAANNYAQVTTPLFPPNEIFPANTSTPGGRDFGATWTDKQGRKWLFGGRGFPFPDPLGKQNAAFLNDLWVFDGSVGGWVPSNLSIFPNAQNLSIFQVRVDPLEAEDVPTGSAPGSRWGSSSWTDAATGDLYLFGGQGVDSNFSFGVLNDLWKCTPNPATVDGAGAGTSSCPWSHVGGAAGGSTIGNTSGIYGIQNNPGGVPGSRWAAATVTDAAGHVWLFGGQGEDSAGTIGLLNDLWEFTGGQWTWIGPSTSNTANHNGNYPAAVGTGNATTAPGGRQHATLWADTSGNIWLFGGFGLDSAGTGNAGPPPAGAILNDLWEFNITTKQWIWVSGSNLANQTGTYVKEANNNLDTGVATSVPGSRWGAVGWSDANNNLWFFGGWGYGTTATVPTGFLDDIWEYQHSSGNWIWWKGISNVNQNSVFATIPIPFAEGVPFTNNVVGGRRGTAIWPQADPEGFIWMFGGEGYDSSQGSPPGYLNDLWLYLPFPN